MGTVYQGSKWGHCKYICKILWLGLIKTKSNDISFHINCNEVGSMSCVIYEKNSESNE